MLEDGRVDCAREAKSRRCVTYFYVLNLSSKVCFVTEVNTKGEG